MTLTLTGIVELHPRLLPPSTKYVNPTAFGFPLDDGLLQKKARDLDPESSDGSDCDKPSGMLALMDKPEGLYRKILPNSQPRLVCGFVDRYLDKANTAYSYGDKDEDVHFLALFKCTRPDERFLPPPETLQKLKDVMAAEGFSEAPYWFTILP